MEKTFLTTTKELPALTPEQRESAFMDYLGHVTSRSGSRMNERYISNLRYAIRLDHVGDAVWNVCEDRSLFTISSSKDAYRVYEEVKEDPRNRTLHGTGSAVCRHYAIFLEREEAASACGPAADKHREDDCRDDRHEHEVNPNIVHTPPVGTATGEYSHDEEQPHDLVIVDYTEPYESFGWRGHIHLELDRTSGTITAIGWSGGPAGVAVSDHELQRYKAFFSDTVNLRRFFDRRYAYSTPADTHFTHFRYYSLKISWNGMEKEISVGYPDIPFKHPFSRW